MTSNSRAISGFSERTPSQVRLALLAIAGAMVLASAAAANPVEVALLERVSSNSVSGDLMEYVRAGQIIRLGPRETIVLSYMSSCLRETITGGTVTVGKDWSAVQSGEVQRLRDECGGKMILTGAQSPIAGRTFRGVGTVNQVGDRRAQ